MKALETWIDLGKRVLDRGGVALVIGKVDTGKSTLARTLLRLALDAGRRVAIVDSDIGQAGFGPPACMSLTLPPRRPILRFIGATSPAGHLLQVTVGVKLLVERAWLSGADLIIVDTSGMIQGPLGILLKLHKIELVHPNTLLVLQKEDELKSLLQRVPHLPDMEISLLPVSREARVRSPAERRAYRRRRFSAYFEKARAGWIDLSLPGRMIFGPSPSVGSLAGLLDAKGETLGLGVVKRLDANKALLLTPVKTPGAVRFLQISSIRLGPDWEEKDGLRIGEKRF
ncbi:MAG TPA: Clp1/GlmU family protein [Candidatus Manganitrophaceae bacterium]|nr:Clp1/GlmU family protein [Candidatus Manganitrophaceae bacterium]